MDNQSILTPGTILFLNGTSSSGKTSLIKAIQEKFDEPFLDMGLDKFIWMLPKRYFYRPLWDDVLGKANQAGQTGHWLIHTMHQTILTNSNLGNYVAATMSWWNRVGWRNASNCSAKNLPG